MARLNLFQDIPLFRRRYVRFALLPGALLLMTAIAFYIRTEASPVLLAATALFILVVAWCAWYWRSLRRRARTILIKTRGLTCTTCGYSLVGMDENGQCPECGHTYYADHLAQCWSKAAGFPQ
jgi:uncharacterized paraquat-inducible protein A